MVRGRWLVCRARIFLGPDRSSSSYAKPASCHDPFIDKRGGTLLVLIFRGEGAE